MANDKLSPVRGMAGATDPETVFPAASGTSNSCVAASTNSESGALEPDGPAARAESQGVSDSNDDQGGVDADISTDDDGATDDAAPSDDSNDYWEREARMAFRQRDQERAGRKAEKERADALQSQVTELASKLKSVTDSFAALRRSRIEAQLAPYVRGDQDRLDRFVAMALQDGIEDAGEALAEWTSKYVPSQPGGVPVHLHGQPGSRDPRAQRRYSGIGAMLAQESLSGDKKKVI